MTFQLRSSVQLLAGFLTEMKTVSARHPVVAAGRSNQSASGGGAGTVDEGAACGSPHDVYPERDGRQAGLRCHVRLQVAGDR
jgi:hypothetical protein